MRLKARIRFSPRSSSTEAKEEWLAFVSALAEEWNANGRPKMMVPGAIVLDKDSSQYNALRALFLTKANNVGTELVGWNESVEAIYSEPELEQCEILALHINGEAGLGGNAYAEVYELETCRSCGFVRIVNQLRDPVVDLRRARKDFADTQSFFEHLVSSRLKSMLEHERIAWVEFRPVSHAHPSRPVKWRYFQLLVYNVLSPLIAPKHTYASDCEVCGREHDGAGNRPEKPDPWTEIRYFLPGPWDEMHFPQSSYRGWDLMRTEDVFGGGVRPSDSKPRFSLLLVSQRLFRLLRHHRITGFWVEPAHLDPVGH